MAARAGAGRSGGPWALGMDETGGIERERLTALEGGRLADEDKFGALELVVDIPESHCPRG